MNRTAAVDYGLRRIGLAVSDPLGITVRGLETVDHGPDVETAARRVGAALAEEQVDRVLVGLALHADGSESDLSAAARRFAARLARREDLAVGLLDETLTTWVAEEALRGRGIHLRDAKKQGLIDREAARALLSGWLRGGATWPPAGGLAVPDGGD